MNYRQLILDLEKELLKQEVRKEPEKLRNLLSEDFIEYCSSGVEYKYNSNDIFYEEDVYFEIVDFDTKVLSDDCILATYKITKFHNTNSTVVKSLRSSIWKLYNDKWKMIFHQGTLIK